MRRSEFREAITLAAQLTGDKDLVIVGSQALHGSFPEGVLTARLFLSMEVDILTADDPEGNKMWALAGSAFSQRPVEIDGVDVGTPALPVGWVERLVPFPLDNTPETVIGWCLEPHDLMVSKVAAGRDKDRKFVRAAAEAALFDPAESLRRTLQLDHGCFVPTPERLEVAQFFLASLPSPPQIYNAPRRRIPKNRRRPRREDFVPPRDIQADLRQSWPEP